MLFQPLLEIPDIGLKSEKDVVREDKWGNIKTLSPVVVSLSIDLAVRVLSSSTYTSVAGCLSWGVENSSSFSSYISLVCLNAAQFKPNPLHDADRLLALVGDGRVLRCAVQMVLADLRSRSEVPPCGLASFKKQRYCRTQKR